MTEPIPQTSNLAIAALLFSCLSVILGPFGSIPGIILGLKARKQIAPNPTLSGSNIATAGIVVGIGFSVLFLILAILGFLLIFMGPVSAPHISPIL